MLPKLTEFCEKMGAGLDGYAGPLCGSCDAGHYRLGTVCLECAASETSAILVFLAQLAALMLLWYLINAVACTYLDNLDLTLNFFQILATIHGFSLSWPPVIQPLIAATIFVDFDFDVVSPNCFVNWGYAHDMTLMIVFPIALFLVLLAKDFTKTYRRVKKALRNTKSSLAFTDTMKVAAKCHYLAITSPAEFTSAGRHILGDSRDDNDTDMTFEADTGNAVAATLEAGVDGDFVGFEARRKIASSINKTFASVGALVLIMYNVLSSKAMGVFLCTSRGVGCLSVVMPPHPTRCVIRTSD